MDGILNKTEALSRVGDDPELLRELAGVFVNGKPGKASYRIRYGDQVRIVLPPPMHDLPVPEDIPLDVLYEDEFLALVNHRDNGY